MKQFKLRLIILFITNDYFSLASKLTIDATESSIQAPTNDSTARTTTTTAGKLHLQDHSSQNNIENNNQQLIETFNLSALANTIQDSANTSINSNSSSSSASASASSYHLIDSSGSLADPKSIYLNSQSGHSNHRDYPSEPYPSASYTSSIIALPSSNLSSLSSLSSLSNVDHQIPNNHQQSLSATRSQFQPMASEEHQFINSYGNQSPSSSRNHYHQHLQDHYSLSHYNNRQQQNHNYGNQGNSNNGGNSNSQLLANAGLIQNLTAALFPVKHISNATLQSLSDLLNKTRHHYSHQNHHNHYDQQQHFNQPPYLQTQQTSTNQNHKFIRPPPTQPPQPLQPQSQSQSQSQPNYNHVYTNLYSPTTLTGVGVGTGDDGQSTISLSSLDNLIDGGDTLPLSSLLYADQLRPKVNNNNNNNNNNNQNKFGFRDPAAVSKYQIHHNPSSASIQLMRPTASASSFEQSVSHQNVKSHNKYHNNQSGNQLKTSSNIYNTYTPFGGGPGSGTGGSSSSRDTSSSGSINILPLITNGQSLNQLAASILSSNSYGPDAQQQLLDSLTDGLARPPGSTSNHHNHQYSSQQNLKPSTSGTNYNYIQHHQGAQRDHLDKVVYHSTPFRPSIVSPPASMSPQASANNTGLSSSSTSSYNNNNSNNNSNKSPIAFGTLSSPTTSSISDTKSSDYVNPIAVGSSASSHIGNSNNSTRYLTGPTTSSSQTSEKQTYPVTFNDDPTGLQSYQRNISSVAGRNSTAGDSVATATAMGSIGSSNNKPPSLLASSNQIAGQSSALLDIYEREIDQQIRDAFLGESGNILSTMASRLVQNPKVSGGLPGWSYDEPNIDQQALIASLIRASPQQQQQMQLGAANGNQSPLSLASQTQQIEQFIRPSGGGGGGSSLTPYQDSLSDALHELPTFSAADLQPIFPTLSELSTSSLIGPSSDTSSSSIYSPITSASQESSLEQQSTAANIWPPLPTSAGTSGFGVNLSGNQLSNSEETQNALTQTLQQLFNQQQHQQTSTTSGKKHKLLQQQQQQQQPSQTIDQQTPQAASPATGSAISPLGFPSILLKLSPFAPSFLANPFNHLYSSLPKNKNVPKTKPTGNKSNQSSGVNSPFNKLLSSQQSGLKSPGQSTIGNMLSESKLKQQYTTNNPLKYQQQQQQQQQLQYQRQQQQQQQQQIASLLASLMAAATQSNLNLADSNISGGGASMSSNNQPASIADTIFDQQADQSAPSATKLHHTNPWNPIELGLSLAGGGISPLLWRTLFPASQNQRQPTIPKLSSSSFTNGHTTTSTQSLLNHQNPLYPFISSATTHSTGFVPSQNSFGSQRTSQLPNSMASSASTLSNGDSRTLMMGNSNSNNINRPTNTNSQHQNYKPKLKIRILKIPIAVYDQPAATGSQRQSATSQTAISLLPSNGMQMQTAASLLTGLPCPLAHTGQQLAPHTIDKHLISNNNLSALLSANSNDNPVNFAETFDQASSNSLDNLMNSNSIQQQQEFPLETNFLQSKLLQMLH